MYGKFGSHETWGKPAFAKLYLQGALLQFADETVVEMKKWRVAEKVMPFMARHGYAQAHTLDLLRQNESNPSGVFYDPRPGQEILALRPRAQIIAYLLCITQDTHQPLRAALAREFMDAEYGAVPMQRHPREMPDHWVR